MNWNILNVRLTLHVWKWKQVFRKEQSPRDSVVRKKKWTVLFSEQWYHRGAQAANKPSLSVTKISWYLFLIASEGTCHNWYLELTLWNSLSKAGKLGWPLTLQKPHHLCGAGWSSGSAAFGRAHFQSASSDTPPWYWTDRTPALGSRLASGTSPEETAPASSKKTWR